MSSTPSSSAPHALIPVHEAARLLGGSPALYTALIEGGIIEGELRDGTLHVDTAVVGAALAVRTRTSLLTPIAPATCDDADQPNGSDDLVDGAA